MSASFGAAPEKNGVDGLGSGEADVLQHVIVEPREGFRRAPGMCLPGHHNGDLARNRGDPACFAVYSHTVGRRTDAPCQRGGVHDLPLCVFGSERAADRLRRGRCGVTAAATLR